MLKHGMTSLSSQSEHLPLSLAVSLSLFLFLLISSTAVVRGGETGGADVSLNKNLGGARYCL